MALKYIVQTINSGIVLIGLGTVGLGVWALIDDDKILILTEVGDADNFDVVSLIRTGAMVLIASGGVAVLIGFLGCCGAVKENNCLLFAIFVCITSIEYQMSTFTTFINYNSVEFFFQYCVVMVIILFVQIAAVVIAAIFQNKVTEDLKVFLKSRLSAQYEGSITTKDPFSLGLDVAQIQFECCGIDNYMDFLSATKWQDTKNASTIIPLTCCRFANKGAYYTDYQGLILKDPSCETSPSDQNSNFRKASKLL
ncbi:tetraspanin-18-like [Saccostrea echinata]|uniref:tetraspanin-18-like n=1 Tax=Saccostrea echinata TaxID=191078 RepID=UPI002A7F6228|nr:tetraspanin-18-like [Saccostrea echinata]